MLQQSADFVNKKIKVQIKLDVKDASKELRSLFITSQTTARNHPLIHQQHERGANSCTQDVVDKSKFPFHHQKSKSQ